MFSRLVRLLPALALAPALIAADAPPNSLTEAEKSEGWSLLFDGKTSAGWRGFKKPEFPSQGWTVRDGLLGHLGKAGGGDIITVDEFTDYDLRFDWKIDAGGNSGLKYFITEDRGEPIGHEYQLLGPRTADEATRDLKHATASFYDVLPVGTNAFPRSPGEWNQSRIVVHGSTVEHWLNGEKVLTYGLGSPAVRDGIAASKFKAVAGFGTRFPHHLLLQDHGGEIWFRNVKIRPL